MEEELRSLREQLDYSRRLFRLQCEELFDLRARVGRAATGCCAAMCNTESSESGTLLKAEAPDFYSIPKSQLAHLPKQATGARRQLEPDPYFYVVLARWSAALFTQNIHGTRHGQPPHRSVHFTSRHTRAKVRARSFS